MSTAKNAESSHDTTASLLAATVKAGGDTSNFTVSLSLDNATPFTNDVEFENSNHSTPHMVGCVTFNDSLPLVSPESTSTMSDSHHREGSITNEFLARVDRELTAMAADEFTPFVRLSVLRDYWTRHKIKDILSATCAELPATISQPLTDDVSQRYLKVFSILVCISKASSIVQFVDEELSDSCLPLRRNRFMANSPESEHKVRSDHQLVIPCTPFKGWTAAAVQSFMSCQWLFTAPFFSLAGTQPRHYNFDDQCVLPFVNVDDHPHSGGFSKVHQVRIHPSHFGLSLSRPSEFRVSCNTHTSPHVIGSD